MVSLIMSIYNDLREPFNVWLYNDCPFTGHKAKNNAAIVKQKAIAASNNLKAKVHAFMQNPNK